jgi:hypothetical protein
MAAQLCPTRGHSPGELVVKGSKAPRPPKLILVSTIGPLLVIAPLVQNGASFAALVASARASLGLPTTAIARSCN